MDADGLDSQGKNLVFLVWLRGHENRLTEAGAHMVLLAELRGYGHGLV